MPLLWHVTCMGLALDSGNHWKPLASRHAYQPYRHGTTGRSVIVTDVFRPPLRDSFFVVCTTITNKQVYLNVLYCHFSLRPVG